MERSARHYYDCPLEASLEIIGGKWTQLVLWHLMDGPRRPGKLRRAIGGVSEKMLLQTLHELETYGMVQRTSYPEVPPRVEYAFTEKAELLLPALQALCDWGAEHSGLYQPQENVTA